MNEPVISEPAEVFLAEVVGRAKDGVGWIVDMESFPEDLPGDVLVCAAELFSEIVVLSISVTLLVDGLVAAEVAEDDPNVVSVADWLRAVATDVWNSDVVCGVDAFGTDSEVVDPGVVGPKIRFFETWNCTK